MANQMSLSPQCADILSILKAGPHTSLQLRKATGVMALTSRIHELRAVLEGRGLVIETRLIAVRNRHRQACNVAEYTLRRAPRARGKGRAVARAKAKRA